LDSSDSRWDFVAGYSYHSNELLGFVKGGEYVEYLSESASH